VKNQRRGIAVNSQRYLADHCQLSAIYTPNGGHLEGTARASECRGSLRRLGERAAKKCGPLNEDGRAERFGRARGARDARGRSRERLYGGGYTRAGA